MNRWLRLAGPIPKPARCCAQRLGNRLPSSRYCGMPRGRWRGLDLWNLLSENRVLLGCQRCLPVPYPRAFRLL